MCLLQTLGACENAPRADFDPFARPEIRPPVASNGSLDANSPGAAGSAAAEAKTDARPAGSSETPASAAGASAKAFEPETMPAAGINGPTAPEVPPDSALEEIIAFEWELAPGTEKYLCARRTVVSGLYVDRLRGAFPRGTHHTSLMVAKSATGADRVYDCSLLEVEPRIIAGGGLGTKDLVLPRGVAMRLDPGSQLLMQTHLFNPTDQPLRGRSATRVGTVARGEVQHEADGLVAQLVTLNIPPGRSSVMGRCTFNRAQTLVGFLPHMHLTGTHAKLILHVGGQTRVIHDRAFSVEEQTWYDFPLVQVQAGDSFEYACTYENGTGTTLHFGEKITQEMCMFGVTRYPAGDDLSCLW